MRFNGRPRWADSIVKFVTIASLSLTVYGSASDELYVVKRAQASTTTTSSSSKSSTTSTSTKCTGSKQECQKPSDVEGLTVGLAIAIPVAVVILVCGVIFFKVYRRNKKEAQEDNDPDFDGDIEYMPSLENGRYPLGSVSNSSNSRTPVEFKENYDNYFPPYYGNRSNSNYRESPRNSRQKIMDPFFVPQMSDETSLRDFAKQIQSDELGPYRLASNPNSRSASHYSLPVENNLHGFSQRINSSFGASILNDDLNLQKNITGRTDSTSSTGSQVYNSPVKSAVGEVTKQYVEDTSGYDVEHSKNETTMEDSFSSVLPKPEPLQHKDGISRDTFNFEMLNGDNLDYQSPFEDSSNNVPLRQRDPQVLVEDEHNADERHDQNRILHLSAEEEENIQRMKSIYKVYLDRQGTVKQNHIESEPKTEETPEIPETSERREIEGLIVPEAAGQHVDAASFTANSLTKSQDQLQLPEETHRIASSIYSAAPSQAPQFQNFQQPPMSNGNPIDSSHYESYTQPFQPMNNLQVQQQPMQYYQNVPYPNQYQHQQHVHPQTFESINELPMPTSLPYSSSSHSLTSFKPRPKQAQLTQLQAARINGTAVNPMDHPQMFYSQDDLQSYTNDGYNQPRAPYQLRQSVVMTNPSDLTAAPRFKPAGSMRNMSAMSSRNNSMTTGVNQQFIQQQMYDHRVSGILNDNLVQPPNVTAILPHSSSQEDLRKQIGSSHNYNVV